MDVVRITADDPDRVQKAVHISRKTLRELSDVVLLMITESSVHIQRSVQAAYDELQSEGDEHITKAVSAAAEVWLAALIDGVLPSLQAIRADLTEDFAGEISRITAELTTHEPKKSSAAG
jgi:hypothetical protein